MHSTYARLNNASAFLSSCLMALLVAITLSSFVFDGQPTGTLEISKVKVIAGKAPRYPHRKQEMATVNFNISADLTPLFNWNTKQLFLYLEAEYLDSKGERNDVVIWDRIVRRKEDAVIKVAGKNKYVFRDPSKSFKNINAANYTLRYNLMPHVGMLTYGEAVRAAEPIPFPKSQTR